MCFVFVVLVMGVVIGVACYACRCIPCLLLLCVVFSYLFVCFPQILIANTAMDADRVKIFSTSVKTDDTAEVSEIKKKKKKKKK
jgi:hypothetical protein